jgi:hypothetical protein
LYRNMREVNLKEKAAREERGRVQEEREAREIE